MPRFDNKKLENLKELTTFQLNEMLERQTHLLKHRHVVDKLPDKGESLRKFLDLLQKEIENRKAFENLTGRLESASISNSPGYSQQLCSREHVEPEPRFKPFVTLVHRKEPSYVRDEKHQECAALEPKYKIASAKPVPLEESLRLQVNQVNRLKEEKKEGLVQSASKLIEGSERGLANPNDEGCEIIDLDSPEDDGDGNEEN